MPTPDETLLQASRRLNDQIRALDGALASGRVPASSLEALRQEASDALRLLGGAQGGGAVVSGIAPKVAEHLELFREIAGSTGTDPVLARKLLAHLLEEQLELTAQVEREAGSMPGGAAHPAPGPLRASPEPPPSGPPSPGAAAGLLPGGRRPLTVGSLIGR